MPTCFKSSRQCQVALSLLGSTRQHKMIEKAMDTFKLRGRPIFEDYIVDKEKTEIRLQCLLMSYFSSVAEIAGCAYPSHDFEVHPEPCVYRASSKAFKSFYSDYAVKFVQSNSVDNELYSFTHGKLCILVELKHGGLENMHQPGFANAFSQLMHAAALAFRQKRWENHLCCCLGSLNYWHVFLLKTRGTAASPTLHISQYNVFALPRELVEKWEDNSMYQVISMYRRLLERFLLWLWTGMFAPGPQL